MADHGESSSLADFKSVINEAVSRSVTAMSTQRSNVIQSRFESFKRELSDEYRSFKKAKRDDIEFKSKGNKDQFHHSQEVLETLLETSSQARIGPCYKLSLTRK